MTDDTDLMGQGDDADDERLLEKLRRLAAGLDAVPIELIDAAKACFAWRTFDAEVAELTHDSELEDRALAEVRGTAPEGRFLSFESPTVTVEMEAISSGSRRRLMGELVPPQPGPVEVRQPGRSITVVADAMGRFLVDDLPPGPLSLRCRGGSDEGVAVVTDWVLL